MGWTTVSRRRFLIGGAASALGIGPALAEKDLALLYRGRIIVTGTRPETRIPGLKRTIVQALCRVSGDQRLAKHPMMEKLAGDPLAAVKDWSYRDLYAFRPIRDEQGTRDRPYEMTVQYVPEKIDAMLKEMGSKPWLGKRPMIVVFLAVHHIGSQFVLGFFGDKGELMREAFDNAAWNSALEVRIPTEESLAKAGLTVDTLPQIPLSSLTPLLDRPSDQIPLAGTLDWSKELLAWKARWRMVADGQEHRWAVEGVNFDNAFVNAIGGAALILSGNGAPT